MTWWDGFVAEMNRPAEKCPCGHHFESHVYGFGFDACIWCGCRNRSDSETSTPRALVRWLPGW